jgi:hypothetical protein
MYGYTCDSAVAFMCNGMDWQKAKPIGIQDGLNGQTVTGIIIAWFAGNEGNMK